MRSRVGGTGLLSADDARLVVAANRSRRGRRRPVVWAARGFVVLANRSGVGATGPIGVGRAWARRRHEPFPLAAARGGPGGSPRIPLASIV